MLPAHQQADKFPPANHDTQFNQPRHDCAECNDSFANAPAAVALDQASKNFLIACTVAARPARAIDVVSGIFFGQTATQFCALPQT